jgi:hypothetical protein
LQYFIVANHPASVSLARSLLAGSIRVLGTRAESMHRADASYGQSDLIIGG